jgi:hypothetical protein
MSNSIGNLKNSGLQGNNFPWQLKMLQGLQGIYDEVKKPLTCLEDSVALCAPLGGLDVNLHDGSGTPITSTSDLLGNTGIDVNIIGGVTLEVNLDPDNDSVGMYGYTDINDPLNPTAILVNSSGQLDIRPLTCADQITLCNNGNPVGALNPLPNALYNLSGNAITSTFISSTSQYALDVNVAGPIGQQSITSSVSTALATEQANVQVIPMVIDATGTSGDLTAYAGSQLLSISFASRGTAPVILSVDGNNTLFRLLPGETLTMDANGVMNYYDPTLFYWDATAAGAAVLIAFNYI